MIVARKKITTRGWAFFKNIEKHFCIKVRPDKLLILKYRMSTSARVRQTEGTQRGTINGICSTKISVVLNHLLLKVNLRFKSQHAV